MRKWLLISISFLVFSWVLVGCQDDKNQSAPSLPKSTVWFNSPKSINLPDFKGKQVLIAFMTHNCKACQKLTPVLQKLQQKYRKQIIVLGVFSPFDKPLTRSKAKRYLKIKRVKFPVAYDPAKKITDEYKVQVWPTTVLIDKAGKVKQYIYGVKSQAYFTKLINQH